MSSRKNISRTRRAMVGAAVGALIVAFASPGLEWTAKAQAPAQAAASPASVDELVGLWKAKKRFGPDA